MFSGVWFVAMVTTLRAVLRKEMVPDSQATVRLNSKGFSLISCHGNSFRGLSLNQYLLSLCRNQIIQSYKCIMCGLTSKWFFIFSHQFISNRLNLQSQNTSMKAYSQGWSAPYSVKEAFVYFCTSAELRAGGLYKVDGYTLTVLIHLYSQVWQALRDRFTILQAA